MKPKHGNRNGSGRFEIGFQDMGGWVRVNARVPGLPDEVRAVPRGSGNENPPRLRGVCRA